MHEHSAGRATRTLLKLIEGSNDQLALNSLNLLDYIVKNNCDSSILMNLLAEPDYLKSLVKTVPRASLVNSPRNLRLEERTQVQIERFDRVLVLCDFQSPL